jgi:hypothetical protein
MNIQKIYRENKIYDALEIKTGRRPESEDKQPSPCI